MAIQKKIYAVEVGGKTLFVRAQTSRGAVKGLGSAIAREAEKSVRVLDSNALLDIILKQGVPDIVDTDETAAESSESSEPTAGAESSEPAAGEPSGSDAARPEGAD